ncbi:MAG: hypothetical protein AAF702_30460 [Chloroflexota bacterium]
MLKKLTITIDEAIYEGLYETVGPRRISRFIEDLLRPLVLTPDLDKAYAQMARDEAQEAHALEWADSLIGDLYFDDAYAEDAHRKDAYVEGADAEEASVGPTTTGELVDEAW